MSSLPAASPSYPNMKPAAVERAVRRSHWTDGLARRARSSCPPSLFGGGGTGGRAGLGRLFTGVGRSPLPDRGAVYVYPLSKIVKKKKRRRKKPKIKRAPSPISSYQDPYPPKLQTCGRLISACRIGPPPGSFGGLPLQLVQAGLSASPRTWFSPCCTAWRRRRRSTLDWTDTDAMPPPPPSQTLD
ncbi:hypothetical protein LX36DRAFT_49019 [Colletotrichum falcatum]|nr:hypothetical protein LX36DRAFT_49019 [Colletotrichum falcatum]